MIKVFGIVALLAPSLAGVLGGGGFSSNVVMLNSRNWRREVEESGHAVFINICRQG